MRTPLPFTELTAKARTELATFYRTTRQVRLRTRAQMILLAAAQHLSAPAKVTDTYQTLREQSVRQRPPSLGQPYSLWTLQRLAD